LEVAGPVRILALNGGSSSIKAALFEGPELREIWSRSGGLELEHVLGDLRGEGIEAVGHRIVHGGRAFREPTRVTPEVKRAIAGVASFAPEHNRREVAAIDAMERMLGPGVPQVAVFDTAFHATLPREAYVFPGPYEWLGQGIRRYGFHGISHGYASRRAAEMLGRAAGGLRLVTCHLGGGCSLAAVRDGRSIDTTMGFTPLDGLMMGTRSGAVDPGVLIHLARHCGASAESLDHTLNEESGLKGVSGISGDLREVLAARAQGDDRASLAFGLFVHRLCAGIAAMAASAGGIDAMVFTAGIGENSPEVRSAAAERLAWLGVKIDEERNRGSGDRDIAAAGSPVRVLVVKAQEEREIARDTLGVLAGA
jgi:acetate kinase